MSIVVFLNKAYEGMLADLCPQDNHTRKLLNQGYFRDYYDMESLLHSSFHLPTVKVQKQLEVKYRHFSEIKELARFSRYVLDVWQRTSTFFYHVLLQR